MAYRKLRLKTDTGMFRAKEIAYRDLIKYSNNKSDEVYFLAIKAQNMLCFLTTSRKDCSTVRPCKKYAGAIVAFQ